jgi:hypothetical protein
MKGGKESIMKHKNNPIWIIIWIAFFSPLLIANLQYLDFVLSELYKYGSGHFRDSFWGTLPQLSALLAVDLIAASFYLKKKSNPNWKVIFILLLILSLISFVPLLPLYTSPYLVLTLVGVLPSFLVLLIVDLLAFLIKKHSHRGIAWIISYTLLVVVSLVLFVSGIFIFQFSALPFIQLLLAFYLHTY